MSSAELNIIERGLKGQEWTAERGPITAGDLDKISELCTNNSSALNALPTPFARFFVVKEAFRRALEKEKNPKKDIGDAYNHLVSDTLDVFELLYNLSFHESRWDSEQRKIVIREWNVDPDLNHLEEQVPILGNAVKTYFDLDLKAANHRLYFIILVDNGKDYLLATSSPFTGFITPPDLDKRIDRNGQETTFIGERYQQMPSLLRKSGKQYFRDICLFGERDKDFKNYMFHLVDTHQLGDEMKELRDYIKQIQIKDRDINSKWQPNYKPIISRDGNEIVINGLPIYRDASISTINFFNDILIRLPFRLSDEYYQPVTYANEDDDKRDYDYLTPISREALSLMKGKFECICKSTSTTINFTLKYQGQVYEKKYCNPGKYSKENRGIIIDLKEEGISLNLGIFPNILSPNKDENCYFKVMTAIHDATTGYRPTSIQNLELSFFRRNEEEHFEAIEEQTRKDRERATYGVSPAVVRSQQDNEHGIDSGSEFYEVFGCQFDAICLKLKLSSGTCEGLLIPRWKKAQRTEDTYTYAIDLGTTNTYISSCKMGRAYEPEQLSMHEPMVAFLHNFQCKAGLPLSAKVIENAMESHCRMNFKTEFAPALIDSFDYRFPLRTAFCVQKGNRSKPELFDNCNIAFFYEKSIGLGNQTILTDIKWEDSHKEELRLFIRELLLIIKTDILQKNGVLASTKLIWFRPLSFRSNIKDYYIKTWEEEAKQILSISSEQISCVSESEAPYYYFSKKDSFNSVDAVSIVDIGGGSSDFVYFADGKPQIANSVHFGCDVLWGNGFNDFENAEDNGIYKRFAKDNPIHFEDEDLEKLNTKMIQDKEISTKDVINFWLRNERDCGIMDKLKESYKPLFLYHFTSIVYYMARMYKAKNLTCPRSVLFCGNGSRYIDDLISADRTIIGRIVTEIFKQVYGDDIKNIQVILPESRKECTCYGGLYRNKDAEKPEEFNFQGVSDKRYENVKQLITDFPLIKQELFNTLDSLNHLYEKLLGMLKKDEELDKDIDIENIIKRVSSGIQDSLEKNFKKQVIEKTKDGKEAYHDSIFFLPIIDNILKLTQL